eukprot:CAMPEP_0183790694 /NCGR_PEP_ID=MMETSP0803_2-20130417/1267_1 /TAXON_ID=195967 /ORGANISM="Crustomastix stigmata, Strain CCMP3273" /LENGTH=705 /DNA_ID=CAMNT_0026034947 /DNA_START=225 /DNA_END=2339 /DNA_ORIENTATION=-
MFTPFKRLGRIVDEPVRSAVLREGKCTYIAVAAGNEWQLYESEKLRLVFSSAPLLTKITALGSAGAFVIVACGNSMSVFQRQRCFANLSGHRNRILCISEVGNLLVSMDSSNLLYWNCNLGSKSGTTDATAAETIEPENVLELPQGFTASTFTHPPTFVNKVVVGSTEGRLLLINLISRDVIYEFPGWGAAVRLAVPSLALDIVGLGLSNGHCLLVNFRYNECITYLKPDALGDPVCAFDFLDFEEPLLVLGGMTGNLSIWDTVRCQPRVVKKDAHKSGISAIHVKHGFLSFFSAAGDNTLKLWAYDSTKCRIQALQQVYGNKVPPCTILFCNSQCLVSAGIGSDLHMYSNGRGMQEKRHPSQRTHSVAHDLSLERPLQIAACGLCELKRTKLVSCHEGESFARVWNMSHTKEKGFILRMTNSSVQVTSVCTSACGNFAVLGSASGRVERFNLQSGKSCGEYTSRIPSTLSKLCNVTTSAHHGMVSGIASDSKNQLLLSVGHDGMLNIFDFHGFTPKSMVAVGKAITKLHMNASTGICATAADDCAVRLYDTLLASRCVRIFRGHQDRVTALQISEDSYWLVTAAMDSTLRVYDIPASRQVQNIRVENAISSLSLSPSFDKIATAHVGEKYIRLWSNRVLHTGTDKATNALNSSVHSFHIDMESQVHVQSNLSCTTRPRFTCKTSPRKGALSPVGNMTPSSNGQW